MQTVTCDEAVFIGAQPHRPGGVSFRHLLHGEEDAPDNYSLSLVRVDERYEAVRHRHNFEQVRVMLEGSFGFGPGAVQETGSVGYFCEGTYYTQLGKGPSLTLLLQCGGASGSGYMSFDRLQRGNRELAQCGRFEDGVFTWLDDSGKKHNQDGYEALWQRMQGRPVVYPKPRYQAPVILWPEHFDWLPVAPGVGLRRLGQFTERGLGIAQWRLQAGAELWLPAAQRRELMFVETGEITVAQRTLPERSALEVLPGEELRLNSGPNGARVFGFSLPRFG